MFFPVTYPDLLGYLTGFAPQKATQLWQDNELQERKSIKMYKKVDSQRPTGARSQVNLVSHNYIS